MYRRPLVCTGAVRHNGANTRAEAENEGNQEGDNMKKAVIQILIAALLAVSTIANAAESDAEIVAKLEKMAGNYPSLVDAKGPVISPPTSLVQEWYRRKVFVTNVAYDVRRTDSLVSPYSGTISYFCDVRGTKGTSEESVKSGADTFNGIASIPCTANYAYQSSRWVLKSVACQSLLTRGYEPVRPDSGTKYFCQQALPSE
jgi:hypothetical protein